MSRISAILFFCAGMAWAGDHVRVILDNSGSMVRNDRPRLATLATLLLYDLADPNLTQDDTFQVFTFDPDQASRVWTSGPPPALTVPRIRAMPRGRPALAEALRAIPYRAKNTYYFHPLRQAISDLKATPGGTTDRRVIVLITDGLPEDPDTSLITRDLLAELDPNRIRLYTIAFGPEMKQERARETLRRILTGRRVAEPLIDPDGSNLLESMLRIFSRSFGYSNEEPMTVSGPTMLPLDGGHAPARVAVVTFWPKPGAPALNMTPPPNGNLNIREGIQTGEETGASYRAAWVIRPNEGAYRLAPESPGAMVAVLRPATLQMSVIPQPPLTQTQVTMAKKEFPLRIMTRLPGGVRGDPGEDLKFSAQVHGPGSPRGYDWDDKFYGARIPNGKSDEGDGRYYDIAPEFPPDKVPGREFYEGWITTEVQRGEDATLGSATHRVLVYPFMKLSPTPPQASAMVGRLVQPIHTREKGCAQFTFHVDGTLPHPARPVYSLRAVVNKRLATDQRLVRARFLLDRIPVDYADSVSETHSPWYTGLPLKETELRGSHEFCVQGGTPRSMDQGPTVEIPLEFEIMEAPYDTLQAVDPIVEPMLLRAQIAPPKFFEQYGSWIAIGLGLLSILLIAWYTRYRATVPPRLRWAVARADSPSAPVSAMLGDGPWFPRLLGLRVAKVAYVDVAAGAWELGKVSPLDSDLYEFRPANGVTVDNHGLVDNGDLHVLSVRQTYRAKAGERGDYDFRLEYESS